MCGSCSRVTVSTLEYMISTQNLGFTPRHQLVWSGSGWHQGTLLVQALTPCLLLEAPVSCCHNVLPSNCGSHPAAFPSKRYCSWDRDPSWLAVLQSPSDTQAGKWSESWCASAVQKLKALASRSLTLSHLSTTLAISKSTRSPPTP